MPDQKPVAPYQPNKRSVGELLSTIRPQIIVPQWQRSYSWSRPFVDTFWQDLQRFRKRSGSSASDYFLGSVVIVETSNNEHLLLDGQQRLATSAILLSSLRDKVKEYKEDAAHRIQARYLADVNDAKNTTVYKLTLNSYDSEFFKRAILEYRDGKFQYPEEKFPSHSLIRDARNFFDEKITEGTKDLPPADAFHWCLKVQETLTDHMTLISITSTDEDSAAEVFETLNDRGIGLSTPDLLRNLVMRRASPNDRDAIVELWSDVLEFETDTAIKAFIRHYWISHYGDVKTQSLYREIKTHIEEKDIQSLAFSRALSDTAEVYRDLTSYRDDNSEIAELLHDVTQLGPGASILLPFLLAVKQTVKEDNDQRDLMALAINVYVRHSTISQRENSRLENVLYKAARDLRANKPISEVREALRAIAPDDDDVALAFARVTVPVRATQRYLLRKLEHAMRSTKELTVSTPKNVHVEHIYSQQPITRWGNHEQVINRMGNVTLLAKKINVSIKNSEFVKKRPEYEKSELLMTKALAQLSSWDTAAIQKRQEELGKLAPAVWPLA